MTPRELRYFAEQCLFGRDGRPYCLVCRRIIATGPGVSTKWLGYVHQDAACLSIAREAMYGRDPADQRHRLRRNRTEALAWIAAQWPADEPLPILPPVPRDRRVRLA